MDLPRTDRILMADTNHELPTEQGAALETYLLEWAGGITGVAAIFSAPDVF